MSHWVSRGLKRAFDIGIAAVSLPIAIPLVGLLALAVLIDSKGNPIYCQVRVGRGGKLFKCLKLRTMVEGAEYSGAGMYSEERDPRITRLGGPLRRFSLDELPQILNVMRGEMSIVGPRPMPQFITTLYQSDYDIILTMRPGITGIVQIQVGNAVSRSARLQMDKEYVRTWSIMGDLSIIVRTVAVVLTGRGLSRGGGMHLIREDNAHRATSQLLNQRGEVLKDVEQ